MAGTIVADQLEAASTSTLVIKNGVANTPPTIQDSAGTQIGTFCRAWVNFNGTGTVAIRASFNVSSITDNGTGDYTVNFTNALSDANYSVVSTGGLKDETFGLFLQNSVAGSRTTALIKILTASPAGTNQDATYVNIAIFR
jgi:hypothetical protein